MQSSPAPAREKLVFPRQCSSGARYGCTRPERLRCAARASACYRAKKGTTGFWPTSRRISWRRLFCCVWQTNSVVNCSGEVLLAECRGSRRYFCTKQSGREAWRVNELRSLLHLKRRGRGCILCLLPGVNNTTWRKRLCPLRQKVITTTCLSNFVGRLRLQCAMTSALWCRPVS